MFKLFIKDTDVTSGAVPVSWCLPVETLNWLYEEKCEDPYIVIGIVPNKPRHQGRRVIAPLKDLIAYIPFYTKGDNKIFSFIVQDKEMAKLYLQKDKGEYHRSLVTWDNERYYDYYDAISYRFSEIITVNVPDAHFAKEPAQWEKNWVNFWFKYPAEDQCEFRRRRLLAYTVQPIVMFVAYAFLFAFVTVLYLSANIFNILILNKYILKALNPYNFCNSSPYSYRVGPWFCNSLVYPENGFNTTKDYLKFCLMPIVFIPFLTFIYFAFKFIVIAVALAVALIVALSFFGYLIYKFYNYLNLKKREETEYWYLNKDYAKIIICDGNSKPTKIFELPKKNQTIKLKYQQLKSKVCRPFSE